MSDRDSISPACLLSAHLREKEALDGTNWQVTCGTLPSEGSRNICLYDTSGQIFAQSMHDGEVLQHYGIQVRVRAPNYPQGYEKARSLINYLVTLDQESIIEDDLTYTASGVTITSSILSLGQGGPTGLPEFTFNLTVQIS